MTASGQIPQDFESLVSPRRFWLGATAFLFLVVGGVDAAAWLIPGGMLALAMTVFGSPYVFLASYALSAAFVATVLLQAYWCGRMILGWFRARRGDVHTVVNFGSSGVRFAARGVAVVNSVMAIAALVITIGGEYLPVRGAMACVVAASSVWVGFYVHAGRRWDGRKLGRSCSVVKAADLSTGTMRREV
ncbi:hypothetical protein LGT39_14305 [Demequina sp. TTPB684]|nr:hypothetical protein [Demequina sp. TTPB684]MCB2414020.1 hypothetical protein [Demequina sp. TTPB684]